MSESKPVSVETEKMGDTREPVTEKAQSTQPLSDITTQTLPVASVTEENCEEADLKNQTNSRTGNYNHPETPTEKSSTKPRSGILRSAGSRRSRSSAGSQRTRLSAPSPDEATSRFPVMLEYITSDSHCSRSCTNSHCSHS